MNSYGHNADLVLKSILARKVNLEEFLDSIFATTNPETISEMRELEREHPSTGWNILDFVAMQAIIEGKVIEGDGMATVRQYVNLDAIAARYGLTREKASAAE